MSLDLSAAFDTVDHDTLLGRLENRFGITGKALSWLTSYLTDRTQLVKVASEHSTSRKLLCGVPQGSVLGPILYTMYAAPLADIIRQHGLSLHFYADDTQLYLSFNPKATGKPMHSLSRVQSCISDITNWMTSNKLMLNSRRQDWTPCTQRLPSSPSSTGVYYSWPWRDICFTCRKEQAVGVWFAEFLSMDKQVKVVCKSAFFHLRNIAKIGKYISFTHCKMHAFIYAFITSKLDYSNSLLSGLRQDHISKLQLVQNSAARFLTGTRKHEHI